MKPSPSAFLATSSGHFTSGIDREGSSGGCNSVKPGATTGRPPSHALAHGAKLLQAMHVAVVAGARNDVTSSVVDAEHTKFAKLVL